MHYKLKKMIVSFLEENGFKALASQVRKSSDKKEILSCVNYAVKVIYNSTSKENSLREEFKKKSETFLMLANL